MTNLHVIVNNKVATYLKRDGDIVCGNSDYQIEFTFDSNWDSYESKTARFVWNNQYFDVDFTGNTCPVPVIQNTTSVSVGVYAGDLSTTTPAIITCKKSILCGGETHAPESAEHYTNEAKAAADEAESFSKASMYYSELAEEYASKTPKGGSRAFYVDTLADLKSFLNEAAVKLHRMEDGVAVEYSPKDLDTGDTIYIKELNVPDFWWVKTNTTSGAFVYNGETLAHELVDRSTFKERLEEIDAVIAKQGKNVDSSVEINENGEELTPDYSWYLKDTGTEEEPYRIGTPAQLLGLSNLSNGQYDPAEIGETEATIKYFDGCYFIQTANIDMGGIVLTPIAWADVYNRNNGYYSRLYYDGRGHSVSNFVQSGLTIGGLFGYIGSYAPEENKPNCYIKNLTISNANISATSTVGSVVAIIRPGVDIVNCHTTGDVVVDVPTVGDAYAGGIIGYINDFGDDSGYAAQREVYVAYCTNEATVKSAEYAGGIVGYIDGAPKSVYEYCAHNGIVDVLAGGSGYVYAGGIIGSSYGRSDVALVDTLIRKCYSEGKIYSYAYVGGMIGRAYGYNTNYGVSYGYPIYTLEHCYDRSERYINGNEFKNFALVGDCTRYECKKVYKYCHGVNRINLLGEGEAGAAITPYGCMYQYLAPNRVDNNVTIVSSFVYGYSDGQMYYMENPEVIDTYPNIICQLQPLESNTTEMQEKIDELEARLKAVEDHLWPPIIRFEVDCPDDGQRHQFEALEGMTWAEYFASDYAYYDEGVGGYVSITNYCLYLSGDTIRIGADSIPCALTDVIVNGTVYNDLGF